MSRKAAIDALEDSIEREADGVGPEGVSVSTRTFFNSPNEPDIEIRVSGSVDIQDLLRVTLLDPEWDVDYAYLVPEGHIILGMNRTDSVSRLADKLSE